jgi:hypothetical protein
MLIWFLRYDVDFQIETYYMDCPNKQVAWQCLDSRWKFDDFNMIYPLLEEREGNN